MTGSYDANFAYDAAGRNNYYSANVYLPNGQSVLEIAQTFDGNGAPASKVETSRSDPTAPAAVTSTYYLRSTALGGKVVAELDNTGYKRVGHIFAGGMEIATQTIWNPGYGSQVSWTSTNPATGSEYVTDSSRNVGRQERDPLGADVTVAPTNPLVVDDPVFYDSKFNHMPIAYEGGQTEDAQIPDWYLHMANASWDEHLAQGYWQSGHYDIAAQVVANNPNVGVEYNIVGFGLEKPMTGSIFGAQAADFLNALGTMIDNGTLVQTGGPGFSGRREFAHAPPSKGKRVPLSDGSADLFRLERKWLLEELADSDSDCSKFLKTTFGFNGSRVAKAVRGIRAWDGVNSTITSGAAGVVPYHNIDGTKNAWAKVSVADYFAYQSRIGNPVTALQAGYGTNTGRDIYFNAMFTGADILHETLHMFSGWEDDALAAKLHVDVSDGDTSKISIALRDGGCGK